MTRIFKKITALAMAAVTAGALGMGTAAEAVETAPETALPEVYCPVNDDPEFPFNIELDIAENSVNYIDLDEPVYGIKRILDGEALDFGMKVSLKDEFKNFESYTFELFTADYSDKLFSQSTGNGETITVPDMSTAKGYKLSATLESESLTAYYGGQFTIQVELDSTLVVDLFYQIARMEGDAAPYEYEREEDDSRNKSIDTPDLLNSLGIVATTIQGDNDYYEYNPPGWVSDDGETEFTTGIANTEFTVTSTGYIPNLTVTVIDSGGNTVKTISQSVAAGKTIFIRIPNIQLDAKYKILITSLAAKEMQYFLRKNEVFGYAWFSQYVATIGDTEYWKTNKLDEIYNNQYRVFLNINNKNPEEYNGDVFATGCGVVSAAMIFRNLGATMEGYDVRTGYEGTLQADPFTALLSNCGVDGTDLKINDKIMPTGKYKWAETFRESEIGVKFGFSSNMKPIAINDDSLRQAIAQYGYVLIYFDANTDKKHFMVLTGLEKYNSNEPKTFAQRATVYDPAAMCYSTGAGVALSKTTSGHKYEDLSNISSARCFVK